MTFSPNSILPSGLRIGDTIALVSPSMRLNRLFTTAHENSIAFFESQGYKVKTIFNDIPDGATHREQIQHRVRELHAAFADPEVRMVLCTSGGNSANNLLSWLDYDLIRANPKIFVGFSDITILSLAIYATTGLRTFSGPMSMWQFGETPQPMSFTFNHFKHTLQEVQGRNVSEVLPRSETYATAIPVVFAEGGVSIHADFAGGLATVDLSAPRREIKAPGWRWLRAGQCRGALIGGNLGSMLRLAGTRWWPRMDGAILLIDRDMDSTDAVASLTAGLTDLANLGVFKQCTGIVWGRPKVSEDMDQEHEKGEQVRASAHRTLLSVLDAADFRGPVLADVDSGHTDPILTLALGAAYELDSEADEWRLVEDVVKT